MEQKDKTLFIEKYKDRAYQEFVRIGKFYDLAVKEDNKEYQFNKITQLDYIESELADLYGDVTADSSQKLENQLEDYFKDFYLSLENKKYNLSEDCVEFDLVSGIGPNIYHTVKVFSDGDFEIVDCKHTWTDASLADPDQTIYKHTDAVTVSDVVYLERESETLYDFIREEARA